MPDLDDGTITGAAWDRPPPRLDERLILLYLAHRADLAGSRLVRAPLGELVSATRLTRRNARAAVAALIRRGDLGYAATNSYIVHPARKAPA